QTWASREHAGLLALVVATGHGRHSTDAVRRIDDQISNREVLQPTAPPCRVEHAQRRRRNRSWTINSTRVPPVERCPGPFSRSPFVLDATNLHKRSKMKYILLIHQGTLRRRSRPRIGRVCRRKSRRPCAST